jgi:hypothetical protein
MRVPVVSASLLIATVASALAANPVSNGASNINAQDERSTIAPSLPTPDMPAGEKPSGYLRAAEGALAAGRTGEAQQSLEMAQTRMLDRSVVLGQTNSPSDNPTVGQISQALQALAAHDSAASLRLIQTAIATASAQGL